MSNGLKQDPFKNFPERQKSERLWQEDQKHAIEKSNKEAIDFNKRNWQPRVQKLMKESGRKEDVLTTPIIAKPVYLKPEDGNEEVKVPRRITVVNIRKPGPSMEKYKGKYANGKNHISG